MSLVFSYKNLSAPRALKGSITPWASSFSTSFLINCMSTKLNLREGVPIRRILGSRNWNRRSGCMSAAATPQVLHWFGSIAFNGPPIKKVADLCRFRKSWPKIKSAQSFSTTPIFSSYQRLNSFTGTRTKPHICAHRRTRRGGAAAPRAWKISRQTLFSGQPQVPQKSWIIKYISVQWKIPGQLCFSGQAQVAQKSWIIKNTLNIVNSGHPLFFRASASCSKILNVKSIFHKAKNFWATLFFRASASC